MSGAPAEIQTVNLRLVYPDGSIVTRNDVEPAFTIMDLFNGSSYPISFTSPTDFNFSCDIEAPLGSLAQNGTVEVRLTSKNWTLAAVNNHVMRFNSSHVLANLLEAPSATPSAQDSLLTLNTLCGVSVSENDSIQETHVPVASLFRVDATAASSSSAAPVASVSTSGWNPPSLLESARGILTYLEVSLLNGPSVLVAATAQGFKPLAVLPAGAAGKNEEGKPISGHLDFASVHPSSVPAGVKPKVGLNTAYFSLHALLSEVVRANYVPALERRLNNKARRMDEQLAQAAAIAANIVAPHKAFITPPEGTAAALLSASAEKGDATAPRTYSKARAEAALTAEAHLVNGIGGANTRTATGEIAAPTRDWREDAAAILALPRDQMRAELTMKLREQFASCAASTAELSLLEALESVGGPAEEEGEPAGPTVELAGEVLVIAPVAAAAAGSESGAAVNAAFSASAVRADQLAADVVRELDIAHGASDFAAAGDIAPLLSSVVDIAGKRRYIQSLLPGAMKNASYTEGAALFGAEDIGAPVRFCPVLFAKLMAGPARMFGLRPHLVEVDGECYIQLMASESKATTGSDGRAYLVDTTRVTPVLPGASDAGQAVRPELMGRFLVEDDARLSWAKGLLSAEIHPDARAAAVKDGKLVTAPMTGDNEGAEEEEEASKESSAAMSLPKQIHATARRLVRHAVGGVAMDFSLRRVELEAQSVQSTVSILMQLNAELVQQQEQATKTFAEEQAKLDASLKEKAVEVDGIIEKINAEEGLTAEQKEQRVASVRAQLAQFDENTRLQWQRNSPAFLNARASLLRIGEVRALLAAEVHRLKQISDAARGHSDLSPAAEKLELAAAPLFSALEETPLAALVPAGSDAIVNNALKADDTSVVERIAALQAARETEDPARRPAWLVEAEQARETLKGSKGIYTDMNAVIAWATAFSKKIDDASQSLPQQRINLNVNTSSYTPAKQEAAALVKQDKELYARLSTFITATAVPAAVEDLILAATHQTAVSPADVKATLRANGLNLQHLGLVRQALKARLPAALEARALALTAENTASAAVTAADEKKFELEKQETPDEAAIKAIKEQLETLLETHFAARTALTTAARGVNALLLAVLAVETTLLARAVAHVAAQTLSKVPFGQAAGAAARLVTLAMSAEESTTTCRETVPDWLKTTTVKDFRAGVAARLTGHYLSSVSDEDAAALFSLLKVQRVRVAVLSHLIPKLGLKLTAEGLSNLLGQASVSQAWTLPVLAADASSAYQLDLPSVNVEYHTITSAKHVTGLVPVVKRHLNQVALPFTIRAALLAVARVLSLPVTHKGFEAATVVSAMLLESCMQQLVNNEHIHADCTLDVIELSALCSAQAALSGWSAASRETAETLGLAAQLIEVLETGLSPRLASVLAYRAQLLGGVAQETQQTAALLADNKTNPLAQQAAKDVAASSAALLTEATGCLMRAIRLDRMWGGAGVIPAASISAPVDVMAPTWPFRLLQASLPGSSLYKNKNALLLAARVLRAASEAPLAVALPVTTMEGFLNLAIQGKELALDDALVLELMADAVQAVYAAKLQRSPVGHSIIRMQMGLMQEIMMKRQRPAAPAPAAVAAAAAPVQTSQTAAKKNKKK